MKTWRRVDVSARPRPGAKSADELASADMARRARMAAFRGLWGRETSVLVLFAVRRELVARHASQSVANFGALGRRFRFLVCVTASI